MTSSNPQPFVQAGDPLNEFLRSFWQRQVDSAEQETPDFRHPALPLARIKKVMKSDPDVKMIAADGTAYFLELGPSVYQLLPPHLAPILFCKACEIFIAEITARAFIIADSNKRRTLSRSDIAKALSKSDQFDFLIDIVPREELPFPTGSVVRKAGGTENIKQEQRASLGDGNANLASNDTNVGGSSEVLEQLETLLNNSRPGERPNMT